MKGCLAHRQWADGIFIARQLLAGTLLLALGMACGRKHDLETGDKLEPVPYGGGGNSGTNGSLKSIGDIVPITKIIAASSGIPGWSAADLPLTGNAVAIGQAITDGQTPFSFRFAYPPNNFQLAEAHLVIDTARDSSDTEGIFINGVLSGRPPLNMVNLSSAKLSDKIYYGSGASPENTYYIDWSLAHYKRMTRNTFDLDVADLVKGTTANTLSVLKDGAVNVVTGDDSPVYQAFLVYKGLTIASDALSCSQSDTYSFQNVFLHNDGNSVGQAAIQGNVGKAKDTWGSAVGAYAATEFFYDQQLPRVDVAQVNLSAASLAMQVKRSPSGAAALVVNGVGVAELGFDRSQATSAVERWLDDTSAVTAWANFVSAIPANSSAQTVTLNLLSIYGAGTLRSLMAQGKLNVTIAGSLARVYADQYTATRGFGSVANGPELNMQGTYATQVCDVPNDPSSPLTQSGVVEQEEDDGTSPVINSVQVGDITATSARVVWLTDKPSSSQVAYGIGNVNTLSPLNEVMSTFHAVTLTGLLPYKYYSFQAISADKWGNKSTSTITVFTTLR